jgi:hypothetical protein
MIRTLEEEGGTLDMDFVELTEVDEFFQDDDADDFWAEDEFFDEWAEDVNRFGRLDGEIL